MLQAEVVVPILDENIGFFKLPNPCSLTMALRLIKPLAEISTRSFPGAKARPARKADNFIAICEPIVWIMWDPRRLTLLWVSMACYRNRVTSLFYL
jgi:hypothetical protein